MKVYFDNAATTPIRKEVIDLMSDSMLSVYGNPSSTHGFGRSAKSSIENARKSMSKLLNCEPQEIIFTSGGTESDNSILSCAVRDLGVKKIISSPIEHHAVLETLEDLKMKGTEVHLIDLENNGLPKLSSLEKLLSADDSMKLVSLMHINNEIGNIVSCFARRRGNRFGIEIYAPWTDLLSSTLIHDIQMTMSINKSKPVRVFAEAVIRECKEYDSHDAVMAIMKFDDGSLASFETSWVLPKNQPEPLDPALHVIGDKGSIIIEGSSMGLQMQTETNYMKPDIANWPTIDSKVDGCLKSCLLYTSPSPRDS